MVVESSEDLSYESYVNEVKMVRERVVSSTRWVVAVENPCSQSGEDYMHR